MVLFIMYYMKYSKKYVVVDNNKLFILRKQKINIIIIIEKCSGRLEPWAI